MNRACHWILTVCCVWATAVPANAAEERSYRVEVALRVDKDSWSADEEITGVVTATISRTGSKAGETVLLNGPVPSIAISPAPPVRELLGTKFDSAFPSKWTLGKAYEWKFTLGRSQAFSEQAKSIPWIKPGAVQLSFALTSPHELRKFETTPDLFGAFESKKVSITVEAKPIEPAASVKLAGITQPPMKGYLAEHLSWLGVPASDLASLFSPVETRFRMQFAEGPLFFARLKPEQELSIAPNGAGGTHNLRVFDTNRMVLGSAPFSLTAPKTKGVYRAMTDLPPKTLGWFLVE